MYELNISKYIIIRFSLKEAALRILIYLYNINNFYPIINVFVFYFKAILYKNILVNLADLL